MLEYKFSCHTLVFRAAPTSNIVSHASTVITFTDWQWLHSCLCGFVYTCGTSSVDAADCACVHTVAQCVCKQGSIVCNAAEAQQAECRRWKC